MSTAPHRAAWLSIVALVGAVGLTGCSGQAGEAGRDANAAFRAEKDRAEALRSAAREQCRSLESDAHLSCMNEADAEFKRTMAHAQVELEQRTR